MRGVTHHAGFSIRARRREDWLDLGDKIAVVHNRFGRDFLERLLQFLPPKNPRRHQLQAQVRVGFEPLHLDQEIGTLFDALDLGQQIERRRADIGIVVA